MALKSFQSSMRRLLSMVDDMANYSYMKCYRSNIIMIMVMINDTVVYEHLL